MDTLVEDPASKTQSVGDVDFDLRPLEVEVIDFFVSGGQLLGLPKSVGQIYGLLYISPHPLDLEAIYQKLGISKGSASQGLKFLRSVKAVQSTSVPDKRSEHYVAETGLRSLAGGFIREQINPHLTNGNDRLGRIRRLAEDEAWGDSENLEDRVKHLESWHRQAERVIPLLLRIIGQ